MEKVVVDCGAGEQSPSVEVLPLTTGEQTERTSDDLVAQEQTALAKQRDERRSHAIARLERFWANRSTLTAAEVRTESAFTARVLAKVLPYIDVDPGV